MTEVPPPTEHGPCPDCGLCYSRTYPPDIRLHRKVHDEGVNGCISTLRGGLHSVTHKSPMSLQKLAQKAASAALFETKYDFSSFIGIKKRADPFDTLAVLYIKNRRVCGLVVTRQRQCKHTTTLDSFRKSDFDLWRPTEAEEVRPHIRRAIDMIWVLKKWRGQGIARRLTKAIAAHCHVKVADIAHMTPFREDALHLWRALRLSKIYVV